MNIYKCLIASPSDTKTEREICDIVFEQINRCIGNTFNFRIESIKWENSVRPAIGEYSQEVINTQVDYNIFIGIMHNKFGTPTKVSNSGTVEEFDIAYEKIKKNQNIEVMFYFNNEPPESLKDIDTDALNKINTFKKRLYDLGVLYSEY